MIKKLSFSFIKILIVSSLISFLLVYGLNHYGKISCLYDYTSPPRSDGKFSFTEQIPINTKVSVFYFESFFGNKTNTDGGKWTGADFNFESDFWKYSNKCRFYFKGTLPDKEYILYISVLLTLILFIYFNFKDIKSLILKSEFKKTNTILYLIILVLIILYCNSIYENKLLQNEVYDLENKITEKENEIITLEEEIENLKAENDLCEERIEMAKKENDIDREYYDTFSKIDDFYISKQTVNYNIIKNTKFEEYIVSHNLNDPNAQIEINGKDNVIEFYSYISRQYYLMYLQCSYK